MGSASRLLAGLAATGFLVGCRFSNSPSINSKSSRKTEFSDQRMERMQVQSYGSAGLEWTLSAPLAEGYSADGKTVIQNLNVDLYEKAQKSTNVTADEGIMFSGSKMPGLVLSSYSVVLQEGDMFLNGHVVMVSTEGNRISTDWAHYKKKEELIVSRAPVTVTRPDSITHGVGLEATTDLSKIQIYNQTLVIPGKDEESQN